MRGTELNIHGAATRPRGFPDNSKRNRRRGLKNSLRKGALFFIFRASRFVTQWRKKKKSDAVFKIKPPCGLHEMENIVCGQMPRSSAEAAEREDPTREFSFQTPLLVLLSTSLRSVFFFIFSLLFSRLTFT